MKEVGTVAQGVAAVGRPGSIGLGLNRLQTLVFQQFCHAIDAARPAAGLQLDGDPPGAVASLMLPEDVADEGHQFAVLLFSRGFGFRQPGIVAGAADLQRIARGSQRKGALESELFDDGIRIG